jgi:hypothetical protein
MQMGAKVLKFCSHYSVGKNNSDLKKNTFSFLFI